MNPRSQGGRCSQAAFACHFLFSGRCVGRISSSPCSGCSKAVGGGGNNDGGGDLSTSGSSKRVACDTDVGCAMTPIIGWTRGYTCVAKSSAAYRAWTKTSHQLSRVGRTILAIGIKRSREDWPGHVEVGCIASCSAVTHKLDDTAHNRCAGQLLEEVREKHRTKRTNDISSCVFCA